jgi:hypothetical protein
LLQLLPQAQTPLAGQPNPATNQAGSFGVRSAEELARRIADDHRRALRSRRTRDLEAELFVLMVDGEGDNQFADILDGTRVAIPRLQNPYRDSENILRPIVDNQVAYLTTQDVTFIVRGANDADAKAQATIDAALANHISSTQDLKGKLAAAVYLADCYGFCPIHATWRNDVGYEAYEPLYVTPDEMQQNGWTAPTKGVIDLWVGDPSQTTFNEGEKRGSFRVMRYARTMSAEYVRQTYGVKIEGTDRYTPGSLLQRVYRRWANVGDLNLHGSPALQGGQKGEELVAVICEELAPGVDPQWPRGRLSCIALQGAAEAGEGRGGSPVLLAPPQPLPGGRFGAELFYTSCQFDDVHGQRWIAPLAKKQRSLNRVLSNLRMWEERAVNAPVMYSGEVIDEETEWNATTLLNVPNGAGFTPQVLSLPADVAQMLENRAENIRSTAFEQGGYNAASRGASLPGDSGVKVEFLSKIDDTIHGPAKVGIDRSCERLLQTCHALFQARADVPWLLENVGGGYVDLPDDYVHRQMVSKTPPNFKVDSGIGGGTPQSQVNRVMQMVTTETADKQPLMTTAEARAKWPEGSLFDADSDPKAAQRTRAKRMAMTCRRLAKERRQQGTIGIDPATMQPTRQQLGTQFSDPAVQHAGLEVAQLLYQQMPPLPTDDVQAVMEELGQVTQDETEDAIARHAALVRWTEHQQQLMMAQQQAALAAQAQTEDAGAERGAPGAREPQQRTQAPAQGQPAMPTQQQTAYA